MRPNTLSRCWLALGSILLVLLTVGVCVWAYAHGRQVAFDWVGQGDGYATMQTAPGDLGENWPEWMRTVKSVRIANRDDCDLRRVLPLKEVQGFEIVHCRLDAHGLRPLSGLPHLQKLLIFGANVADADLQYLRKCRGLTHLTLLRCPVTDRGVQQLEQMQATNLNLSQTRVTDKSLDSLAMMPLESLNLVDTAVTPKGLECLARMKSLTKLFISSPQSSHGEIQQLAERLGMSLRTVGHGSRDETVVVVYELTREAP